jgi:polysaccharide biosynthesis transport protein
MSSASDSFQSEMSQTLSRYARLNTRPAADPAPRQAPPEAVTLAKVGDFLELDLRRLFVWLRTGIIWIAMFSALGALGGAAFAVLSKPRFTVSTDILVDPANLQVVGDELYASPGQPDAMLLAAGSKLRVLTSGNVLTRVVQDLNLAEDPEFVAGDSTLPPEVKALASLRKNIGVTADARSFVASMAVTTEDAGKSILISNAIVEAFRDELAAAEAEGAIRTVDALDARLSELKREVSVAEENVETYKRQSGLQSSAGELTSTLSLNQINSQMLEAQARLIAAQSTYAELVSGGGAAGAGEGVQTAALDALRAQYATARQQLDSQSMIYGALHPTIVRLRTDVSALEGQIQAETRRLVDAAKARVDEASSALAALTASAQSQRSEVFSDNEAMVRLRELEREAQSKAAVYEAFLARSQQLDEAGRLDTTNIRVISTAVPPPARSWPPRTLLMVILGTGAGLVLGLTLAMGLGMWRDMGGGRRHARA